MGLTLATYLQRCQRLLDDFQFQHYNVYDLIDYTNEGRLQAANLTNCIRSQGSLSTAVNVPSYALTAIALPTGVGYDSALNVDRIWYVDANPARNPVLLEARPLGWFNLFGMTLGVQPSGIPAMWAMYQQGKAGSFRIAPVPNGVYSLLMDVAVLPTSLGVFTSSTDVDALPYPWTDAVPFYAASRALQSDPAKANEAAAMMSAFTEYLGRAGLGVTPEVQAHNFPARSAALGAGEKRSESAR